MLVVGVPIRLFAHNGYWFVATSDCWDIERGGDSTRHLYDLFIKVAENIDGYDTAQDFMEAHDSDRVWCYMLQFSDSDADGNAAIWCTGSLTTGTIASGSLSGKCRHDILSKFRPSRASACLMRVNTICRPWAWSEFQHSWRRWQNRDFRCPIMASRCGSILFPIRHWCQMAIMGWLKCVDFQL